MSTLEKAIQYSRNSFANGEFIQRLGSLIEIVTDSKGSVSAQVLSEYYTKGLFSIFEELGIKSKIIDNPINDKPPFLIGTRIESPENKTISSKADSPPNGRCCTTRRYNCRKVSRNH